MTTMQLLEMIVAIVVAIVANSGFWMFIQKKMERKDARSKILVGLAHDMIIEESHIYMQRGDWITDDEYTYLVEYLHDPYVELGGNGAAEKAVEDVKSKLHIVPCPPEGYKNA